MQNDNLTKSMNEEPVFALDIGTRSVIGVVGYSKDGLFHIEATEMREHPKRAMMDGQIEDIGAVAEVANQVKTALEQKTGRKLTKVCVAAAGRALRTRTAFFELDIAEDKRITSELVTELELGAVSAAASAITTQETEKELLCVGHSVVKYAVDGYTYSNIVDHTGKKARVDIIATFLPSPVVASLEAAMQKISLTIDFLTLEPIAAMNAVIPKELRLLNLALVDIGAGTSDIAICDDGAVSAYTMATIAGDEITEAIIRSFLVDFETAEQIKHNIASGVETVSYCDIMGFEYEQSFDDVVKAISASLSELTDTICDKIVEINGKTPAAVFLVGGGSKTPLLSQLVAKRLGLDEKKVAVGSNNFMKKVSVGNDVAYGPEFATPLGIALTAVDTGVRKGFEIEVNGEKKQLLRQGSLTMMDVLLLCGYSYAEIMGKSGKSITYEIDGTKRTARGGLLKPATLVLNRNLVGISAQVNSGDVIQVAPAVSGADAEIRVCDIISQNESFEILVNGKQTVAGRIVYVNGEKVDYSHIVNNGDVITTVALNTLGKTLEHIGIDMSTTSFVINGSLATLNTEIMPGDVITEMSSTSFENSIDKQPPQNDDFSLENKQSQTENEDVNTGNLNKNDEIVTDVKDAQISTEIDTNGAIDFLNNEQDLDKSKQVQQSLSITINGHSVVLVPKKDNAPYIFLDMLTLVEIDPSKPQGDIVLQLNGKAASFLETVSNGDNVDIYWKKR